MKLCGDDSLIHFDELNSISLCLQVFTLFDATDPSRSDDEERVSKCTRYLSPLPTKAEVHICVGIIRLLIIASLIACNIVDLCVEPYHTPLHCEQEHTIREDQTVIRNHVEHLVARGLLVVLAVGGVVQPRNQNVAPDREDHNPRHQHETRNQA